MTMDKIASLKWVQCDFYVVSEETLRLTDHKRRCWLCSQTFKVGDGMTVGGTDRGNKLMHSNCYRTELIQTRARKRAERGN